MSASEFYYGALELEERGHEVGIYEPVWRQRPVFVRRMLDRLFLWQLLPARTWGEVLLGLDSLRKDLDPYDVVVGTTTPIAYGLGALHRVGRLKPPVMGIQCGLVNYRHSRRRRIVNSFVFRGMWTQIFGEGELEDVRKQFYVPEDRVEVNQFGVDTAFWSPGSEEGDYILSVGNDARRDYELLMRVAAESRYKFKVVTAQPQPENMPGNVDWVRGHWHTQALSDEELRDLYRGAKMVVIPLKDSVQPSGQSVCLQAMACGKAVIITDTRGLWSRKMMRDRVNVSLVRPEDSQTLASEVRRLMEDDVEREKYGRIARETVCREASIDGFAERLLRRCEYALAHR